MDTIESDRDVMEMFKWVPAYRVIEIFVESVDYLVSSYQPEPESDSDNSVDNSCSDSLVDVDYIVSDDDFGQPRPHQVETQPEFQTESQP